MKWGERKKKDKHKKLYKWLYGCGKDPKDLYRQLWDTDLKKDKTVFPVNILYGCKNKQENVGLSRENPNA